MGRKKKALKPPTPKAPPPPVEDVEAEFVSSAMRKRFAERAGRGAYITRGERRLGRKGKYYLKMLFKQEKAKRRG